MISAVHNSDIIPTPYLLTNAKSRAPVLELQSPKLQRKVVNRALGTWREWLIDWEPGCPLNQSQDLLKCAAYDYSLAKSIKHLLRAKHTVKEFIDVLLRPMLAHNMLIHSHDWPLNSDMLLQVWWVWTPVVELWWGTVNWQQHPRDLHLLIPSYAKIVQQVKHQWGPLVVFPRFLERLAQPHTAPPRTGGGTKPQAENHEHTHTHIK